MSCKSNKGNIFKLVYELKYLVEEVPVLKLHNNNTRVTEVEKLNKTLMQLITLNPIKNLNLKLVLRVNNEELLRSEPETNDQKNASKNRILAQNKI